jgi:hypothetical protein
MRVDSKRPDRGTFLQQGSPPSPPWRPRSGRSGFEDEDESEDENENTPHTPRKSPKAAERSARREAWRAGCRRAEHTTLAPDGREVRWLIAGAVTDPEFSLATRRCYVQ